MIKILRKFVAWAEKRWPEKVVITQEKYLQMCDEMAKLQGLDLKVRELEKNIANMNVMMGMAMPNKDTFGALLQR